MSIERLSGGLSPADGSDPRTFPEIFNGFADEFEGKNIPAFGTAVPSDGDALVYNDAEGVYEPGEGGAGSLEDLTDTDISAPSADELLRYDGTEWVNTAADATPTVAGVLPGTTANDSAALGVDALSALTSGIRNVAIGVDALKEKTDTNQNVAIGAFANSENNGGVNAVAIGAFALKKNTANNNTALGAQALENATTGADNFGLGFRALRDLTTGKRNVFIGGSSGGSITTSFDNIGIGHATLNSCTGGGNTVIGSRAGQNITTGDKNLILGKDAEASSPTVSNEITLGDADITTIRANVTTITSLSDVRDKTNIETTALGLEVINKVRPVEFTWARRDGTMGDTPDLGFIAQELAEVEDDLGETDRLRLTLRENPEKLEAAPGRLLPVLVKAVQELSAQNDELRARLDAVEGK